jgi:hypothetical protein
MFRTLTTWFTVGMLAVAVFLSSVTASAQVITTVAGNGTAAFCGDGGPATEACLNFPLPPDMFYPGGSGVAVDHGGHILIGDTSNHRVRFVQ